MWRLQVADKKENCKTVYISVLGMKQQVGLRLPSLSPETGFWLPKTGVSVQLCGEGPLILQNTLVTNIRGKKNRHVSVYSFWVPACLWSSLLPTCALWAPACDMVTAWQRLLSQESPVINTHTNTYVHVYMYRYLFGDVYICINVYGCIYLYKYIQKYKIHLFSGWIFPGWILTDTIPYFTLFLYITVQFTKYLCIFYYFMA